MRRVTVLSLTALGLASLAVRPRPLPRRIPRWTPPGCSRRAMTPCGGR